MRNIFTPWFWVELAASLLTLGGIYLGSTTKAGAALYLASMLFWHVLTIGRRMWGLVPVNVATTVLSAVNLFRAVA